MTIEFDIIPIKRWPDDWSRNDTGKGSPFSAPWSSTLELLTRELEFLNAKQVQIQIDVEPSKVRKDGMLRADARASYRGVILSFTTKQFGALSYPCNAYEGWGSEQPSWQVNIRAIALGLESLRRVERYGIANRGQQYAGFAELGSGIAVSRMTEEEAWEVLYDLADVIDDPDDGLWEINELFLRAVKKHHPDSGGDPDKFKLLMEARYLLEAEVNG
jgi:hypothetical protein